MAAKNNITKDSLISKPFSSAYSDGWDKIYMKRPQEWIDIICGKTRPFSMEKFRKLNAEFWQTPMTRKQFETLLNE